MLNTQQISSATNALITGAIEKEPKIYTGFAQLDKAFKGFRKSNVYLMAGLEKSGKSSLVLNYVSNQLDQGIPVGYISTEQGLGEITARLADIRMVASDPDKKKKLLQLMQTFLSFAGIDAIQKDGRIDHGTMVALLKQMRVDGAEFIIFDNLTTLASQAGDKKGWEKIAESLVSLVTVAKEIEIPILLILHIKPDLVISETPQGVRAIISSGEPERVFRESVSYSRRPSLSDVYGGGGALSQLTGSLLLWRPFQRFNDATYKSMSMLIIDSHRFGESGVDIEMRYEGKSGRFTEVAQTVESMTEREVTQLFGDTND